MREITISGKNEIVASGGRALDALPSRRLGAVVMPLVAAAAVAVTLAKGIGTSPGPVASIVNPPKLDARSGKIIDRAAAAETPIYASATLLFGRFLDTSLGPSAILGAVEAPAETIAVVVGTPLPVARRLAKAPPLPPIRPASLGDSLPVAVASAAPAKEASRMLGFIPEDLLGTPRRALKSVASLGESLLDRVIP
jgi:hypothetical protein